MTTLTQEQLVEAWKHTLPSLLRSVEVVQIANNPEAPNSLRIHIEPAGRNKYAFDFHCTYVDDREVAVGVIHVVQRGVPVESERDTVTHLVDDYIRDIHECAQALHSITHA